jgi:hypothetical protein
MFILICSCLWIEKILVLTLFVMWVLTGFSQSSLVNINYLCTCTYIIHACSTTEWLQSYFHIFKCCTSICYEILVPIIHTSVINLKKSQRQGPTSHFQQYMVVYFHVDLPMWHFPLYAQTYICTGIFHFLLCPLQESCWQNYICPQNFSDCSVSSLPTSAVSHSATFTWTNKDRTSLCTSSIGKCEHSQVKIEEVEKQFLPQFHEK